MEAKILPFQIQTSQTKPVISPKGWERILQEITCNLCVTNTATPQSSRIYLLFMFINSCPQNLAPTVYATAHQNIIFMITIWTQRRWPTRLKQTILQFGKQLYVTFPYPFAKSFPQILKKSWLSPVHMSVNNVPSVLFSYSFSFLFFFLLIEGICNKVKNKQGLPAKMEAQVDMLCFLVQPKERLQQT